MPIQWILCLLLLMAAGTHAQVAWLAEPGRIEVGFDVDVTLTSNLVIHAGSREIPIRAKRLGFELKTLKLYLDSDVRGPFRVRGSNPAFDLPVLQGGAMAEWIDAEGDEVWRGWLPSEDLNASARILAGTARWRVLSGWFGRGGRLVYPAAPKGAVSPSGRGRAVFFGAGECGMCHRLGDRGTPIGPSLAGLGPADVPRIRAKLDAPFSLVHPDFISRQVTFTNGISTLGVVKRIGNLLEVANETGTRKRYPLASVQVIVPVAGTIMPPQSSRDLTPGQREALVRFLCGED